MSVSIINSTKIEVYAKNEHFVIDLKKTFDEVIESKHFSSYDIEYINGIALKLCKISDLHTVYHEVKKLLNLELSKQK